MAPAEPAELEKATGSGDADAEAMREVPGEERAAPMARTAGSRWRETVESTGTGLPHYLANETFLATEYAHVVLPNKVHDEADYLRVRTPKNPYLTLDAVIRHGAPHAARSSGSAMIEALVGRVADNELLDALQACSG